MNEEYKKLYKDAEKRMETLIKDYMEDDPSLSHKDAEKKIEKFVDDFGILPLTKSEQAQQRFGQRAKDILGHLFVWSPIILASLDALDYVQVSNLAWIFIGLIYVGTLFYQIGKGSKQA